MVCPEIERALACVDPAVLLIDEIGKMELFSERFRSLVTSALDSRLSVAATIMSAPNPFAEAVKARPDVRQITLTSANRDDVLPGILALLL